MKVFLFLMLSFIHVYGRMVGPWSEKVEKQSSDYNVKHYESQMKSLLYQSERLESLLRWKDMVPWPESLENNGVYGRILYQWPNEYTLSVHVVMDNEQLYQYHFDGGNWMSQSVGLVRDECYGGRVVRNMGVIKVGDVLYYAGGLIKQNRDTVFCGWDMSQEEVIVHGSFDYDGVTLNIGIQNHLENDSLFIFFGNARFVHQTVRYDIGSDDFIQEVYGIHGEIPDGAFIAVSGSIYSPLDHSVYALSLHGNLYSIHIGKRMISFEQHLGKSKLFPINHNLIYATIKEHFFEIKVDHVTLLRESVEDSLFDFDIVHHPKANMIALRANGKEKVMEHLSAAHFVIFKDKIFTFDDGFVYFWNGHRFQKSESLYGSVPSNRGFMFSDGSHMYVYDGNLWKYDQNFTLEDIPDLGMIVHSSGCIIGEYLYIFGGIQEGLFSNQFIQVNLVTKEVISTIAPLLPMVGMDVVNLHGKPLLVGGYHDGNIPNQDVLDLVSNATVFHGFHSSIGHTAAVAIEDKIIAINSHGAHILTIGDTTEYTVKPFRRISHRLYAQMNEGSYQGTFTLLNQNDKLFIFFSDGNQTYGYHSNIENPNVWDALQSDELFTVSSSTGLNNRLYGISGNLLVYYDVDWKITSSFVTPNDFVARTEAAVCSSVDRSIFVFGGEDVANHRLYDLWEFNTDTGEWKKYNTSDYLALERPSIAYFDGKIYMLGSDGEDVSIIYSLESETFQIISEPPSPLSNIIVQGDRIISSAALSSGGFSYYSMEDSVWDSLLIGQVNPDATKPLIFSFNDTLYAFRSDEKGYLYEFTDQIWHQTSIMLPKLSLTHPIVRGNSLIAYPYEIDLVSNHVTILDLKESPIPFDENMELLMVGRKVYLFVAHADCIWDYDLDSLEWGFIFISEQLSSDFCVVSYGEYIYILHKDEHEYHRKWRIGSSELSNQVPIEHGVKTAFSDSKKEVFYFAMENEIWKYTNGSHSHAMELDAEFSFAWKNKVVLGQDVDGFRCDLQENLVNCEEIPVDHQLTYMIYGNGTVEFFGHENVLAIMNPDTTFYNPFFLSAPMRFVQIDNHRVMGVGVLGTELRTFFFNAAGNDFYYPSNLQMSDSIGHGLWSVKPKISENMKCE